MSLKTFHIWQETDIEQKLYALDSQYKVIVYAAEEQIISDSFNPNQMKPQKSIDFIFGGTFYNKFQKYGNANLHFWNNFWLYNSVSLIDVRNIIKKPNMQHLFICLNNEPHYHRCYMIDMLAKNNLINKNVISWNKIDSNYSAYKFRYWKEKITTLSDNYFETKEQHILPREFNVCFLNLVLESTVDGIFITEKTFHPIIIGKPFIVLAAPGFHRFLQSQGFLLYDEIISYDFDKENNLNKRIKMIVEELKRLQKNKYNKLYDKIKDKLDYNRKRALEIVRNQEGIPVIARNFKYYDNIIKEATCKSDTLD